MTAKPSINDTYSQIADVQNHPDSRRIPINKVGIKGIRHPIQIRTREGQVQHTVGDFSMYVDLPHTRKGTHMSRFVEILNRRDTPISVENFKDLLNEMIGLLGAESGFIDVHFPYFVNKQAPVSGVSSYLDYDVHLMGAIGHDGVENRIKVVVPVTSLCPCSKEISKYGAHNQRSHVTVEIETRSFVWIEELIDLIESEASCEIFGLVKRPDEKWVTEKAYENPKFVEDMVRDIAARLDKDERIQAYRIESENFESIHNHSAYAMVERERQR